MLTHLEPWAHAILRSLRLAAGVHVWVCAYIVCTHTCSCSVGVKGADCMPNPRRQNSVAEPGSRHCCPLIAGPMQKQPQTAKHGHPHMHA